MLRIFLLVLFATSLSVSAELVAYYNFDSSDATDQTANGNHGAVGANISFTGTTPFGGGQALVAPGASGATDIVAVPNAPSLEGITHQLTLSLWLHADAAQNVDWFRFMRKGDEGNPGKSWMLNRNSNTQDVNMRIDTNDGAAGQFNQNVGGDSDAVLDGQWHHLIYTVNNGAWAEYLDGQASGSGTYVHGNGFSNTAPMLIGGRGNPNMNGMMDDVAVFDHAISLGEARSVQQFAVESALAYDLGKVNQLFELGLGQQALINGRTWTGVDGLVGAEGSLEGVWNQFAINFGGGMGVASIPEPSSGVLLVLSLLLLARRLRK